MRQNDFGGMVRCLRKRTNVQGLSNAFLLAVYIVLFSLSALLAVLMAGAFKSIGDEGRQGVTLVFFASASSALLCVWLAHTLIKRMNQSV